MVCLYELIKRKSRYLDNNIIKSRLNFDGENEVVEDNSKKKVMILGSGPIRIGQGIEFDYCSVHSTWAFARKGYETIIVNNNPETVSTDFDIADKLYFEPLTAEDVEAIVNLEKPDGAVVQFGGQTAIKLTEALMEMGAWCNQLLSSLPLVKGSGQDIRIYCHLNVFRLSLHAP